MSNPTQYTVYVSLYNGGKAFFSPAESNYGGVDPEVGSEVYGSLVWLTSDLATAQARVAELNAVYRRPDEAQL